MPTGEIHHKAWKVGWLSIIPTGIIGAWYIHPVVGAGILVGYTLGRWCDPDWDQITITNSESRIVNDFKIVGYVLVGYTTIYGAVFRRLHRSFFTHFPFLSTGIRLVYLFWWLYFFIPVLYDWQIVFGISVWIGLSAADTIHWFLDKSGKYLEQ